MRGNGISFFIEKPALRGFSDIMIPLSGLRWRELDESLDPFRTCRPLAGRSELPDQAIEVGDKVFVQAFAAHPFRVVLLCAMRQVVVVAVMFNQSESEKR